MTFLLSTVPKLPKSVCGQILPDFVNAKVIQHGDQLPTPVQNENFDFSIKKSDAFGSHDGEEFNEGATWFPLKLVQFTCSRDGISSYCGYYGKGTTAVYGTVHAEEHKLALAKDEYIQGISGQSTILHRLIVIVHLLLY